MLSFTVFQVVCNTHALNETERLHEMHCKVIKRGGCCEHISNHVSAMRYVHGK